MDAISRYRVLATVSASLAAVLLVAAIALRMLAIASAALVVLLLIATVHFLSSAARVRRIRERQ
jgi:hypothetical protein